MATSLEFGLDVGVYGRLATPENILELAALAEVSGFDSLWLADHVVFPAAIESKYPYSLTGDFPVAATEPLLEPIATMGVLVGATKRLKIGTAVLVIPYRNPVLLARMLVTLDVFSGGRIVLGGGSGWLAEEFAALDTADFAARGAVTDEYLEIFKAVAAGGEVAYQGEHYRFDPILSYPGSVQRPHPPILIGGTTNAALRRVARLGDGWLSVALRPEKIPERLATLRRLTEAQGRRYEDLWLCHKIFLSIGEAKPALDGGRELGTGSVAEITDDLKRLIDLGYQGVILRYIGQDAGEQIAQVDRFAAEIMAKV
ncbi:MAG: TIGR03619 family F420-dependent LLM class oxidoreductase [Alphaproteobacteria bacterium]|nr:TIGR03619 family F420-dependent LLM class oxidoreductase [Alphaproteobacteria bacterium]